MQDAAPDGTVGVLDRLVADVLDRYPYRFTAPDTAEARLTAYRIRYAAIVAAGWRPAHALPDGLERDEYDDEAVTVIGWDGEEPISTGRLVLPPSSLPTEAACGIRVEPAGLVVDVGRMCVVPTYQTYRHAAFIALLSALYLQMRRRGFQFACGMMSPRVRTLVSQLGLQLELLGDDRDHWGELRAPVRFVLTANTQPISQRFGESNDAGTASR